MKRKNLILYVTAGLVSLVTFVAPTNISALKGDVLEQPHSFTEITDSSSVAQVLPMSDFTVREAIENAVENTVLVIEEVVEEVTTEEVIIEEVVEKPYNYYRINDNGWYADLTFELQDYLWLMCEKYDICDYYEVMLAQMYTESSFRPNLISSTNDYGLMQINKCNHDWLSQKLGSNNFLDPYISIEAGCLMMSGYLHKYDVASALVAYNRGESAVRVKGIKSTSYSDKVLANINKLEIIEED